MKRGLFITFEGGEGSGKTTAIKKVEEKLNNENIACITTREPGGEENAEKIREIILQNQILGKTEALLFAASRVEHLKNKIIPAVDNGKIIISDRYVESSIVYQGIARGLGQEKVEELNRWATDGFEPSLIFFFDIDPESALKRLSDNNREKNRLDNEEFEFHQKIYEGYKKVLNGRKEVVMIDAKKTQDEICETIYTHILKVINE